METFDRRKRLLVALPFAAVLGLALAACDGAVERLTTTPSPVASGTFATRSRTVSRTASASAAADDHQLLAAIRGSTAKYQNIDAAFADGYIDDGYGCVDATAFGLDPSVGGMGFHLINWNLHDDPATDPLRPDLLVYEPARGPNGKPKLVALEYEVFRPDWYGAGNTTPPSLLGHEFESLDFDVFQVFALHVWLWLDNPSGMFTDFNPKTSCH